MMEDLDSLPKSASEERTLDKYEELSDDYLGDFGNFGDFKLPDLGVSKNDHTCDLHTCEWLIHLWLLR